MINHLLALLIIELFYTMSKNWAYLMAKFSLQKF